MAGREILRFAQNGNHHKFFRFSHSLKWKDQHECCWKGIPACAGMTRNCSFHTSSLAGMTETKLLRQTQKEIQDSCSVTKKQ
ncbi:MAG: hypothetical protein NT007_18920 [Candidatus Kapabacteria bacterium]|nr:hypothetical protein [Candidatus Kapabacteria bacterium]